MKISAKKTNDKAILPTYATDGSGCFDLYACLDEIREGRRVYRTDPKVIPTGLAFEIPEGHVMLVFSRSGHGFKYSTRLSNCVGVIDADYRGEVMVSLTRDDSNLDMLQIRHGDRVAQAMVLPIPKVEFELVAELSETDRGEGGFGSTNG